MLSLSTSGTVLSLPNAKQLEAGDFNLDELSTILTEALVDDSQRNEIMHLTGDIAVLVLECLDKVGETTSRSWIPGSYHAPGHVVQELSGQFGYSNTLECVLRVLEALSWMSTPPSLLLDRSKNDNAPQRAL